MACPSSPEYTVGAITYQDNIYVEYENGSIVPFVNIVTAIAPGYSTQMDALIEANNYVLELTGRQMTSVQVGYWDEDIYNWGLTFEQWKEQTYQTWVTSEGLKGKAIRVYTSCEYQQAIPPASKTFKTSSFTYADVVGSPVSASEINTKLLGRNRSARLNLKDLAGRVFIRPEIGTPNFDVVQIPSENIKFGDFIGLAPYAIPYPEPIINITQQPQKFGDVYANTGDKTFSVEFDIDWREDEWPNRERGSNDILNFSYSIIVEYKEGTNATIKLPVVTPKSQTSAFSGTQTFSFNLPTDGLDVSDINNTLLKTINFTIIANLTVTETIDEFNLTLDTETSSTTAVSNNGSMTLKVFQLPEDALPELNMKTLGQKYESAIIYRRSIDNTIVQSASRAQRYTFDGGNGGVVGYDIVQPSAPGRNPTTSVEWEWQYSALNVATNFGDEDIDNLEGTNGDISYTTPRLLDIGPYNAVWQGYQFRLAAKPTLTLSKPSEVREGVWDYSNSSDNLLIDYQLKDPEYILPADNTKTVARGFVDGMDFYTRWTGETGRTYYWRIETVSSSTESVASAWNTVSGFFVNEENTLQAVGSTNFNKNEIPLDSKTGTTTSNFRLSVYTNSNFTGRVATTVFKLQYFTPILKLIETQVISDTDNVFYDEEQLQDLNVVESNQVGYLGQALYYGYNQPLKWSYDVVSDVNESTDVTNEIVGYQPGVKYDLVTVYKPGSTSTADTRFYLPTFIIADDSAQGGTSGNREVLRINIWDNSNNKVDQVTLNTYDKLEEFFEVTKTLADASLTTKTINGQYVLTPGSGVMGWGSKPYKFQSPSGTRTFIRSGWQYLTGNSWNFLFDSSSGYYDVWGNAQTAIRDVRAYDIRWTGWNNTNYQGVYIRFYIVAYNNVTGRYEYKYSNTATMRFYADNTTYNKGIIEANLLPTRTTWNSSAYIDEGVPVQAYITTWDVPDGTEVEYQITDNAKVLPTGSGFSTQACIPTTGTLTINGGSARLKRTVTYLPWLPFVDFGPSATPVGGTYPLLAHYTPSTREYAQFRIKNPAQIGLAANSPGVQYGNINNDDEPWFPSPTNTPVLTVRTSDWDTGKWLIESDRWQDSYGIWLEYGDPLTLRANEDSTTPWDFTINAFNVDGENGISDPGYWKLVVTGDAAKYFAHEADLSNRYAPEARGAYFTALTFSNDASTAQKKHDGRYTMTATITPGGPDATTIEDAEGYIGVARIVPGAYGTDPFYTYIWKRKLVIRNTIPAPWSSATGPDQIAVVPDKTTVNEGESVTFTIFDKARSSDPAYDSWNNATPIPAGTLIYHKVAGRAGFTGGSTDFEKTPAGPLTMGASGIAGTVTVTLLEDGTEESTEKFSLRAASSLTNLTTAGAYADSAVIDVIDGDTVIETVSDDTYPGWYVSASTSSPKTWIDPAVSPLAAGANNIFDIVFTLYDASDNPIDIDLINGPRPPDGITYTISPTGYTTNTSGSVPFASGVNRTKNRLIDAPTEDTEIIVNVLQGTTNRGSGSFTLTGNAPKVEGSITSASIGAVGTAAYSATDPVQSNEIKMSLTVDKGTATTYTVSYYSEQYGPWNPQPITQTSGSFYRYMSIAQIIEGPVVGNTRYVNSKTGFIRATVTFEYPDGSTSTASVSRDWQANFSFPYVDIGNPDGEIKVLPPSPRER